MPQWMWINGERVPGATGELFDVQDPSTEEVLTTVPARPKRPSRWHTPSGATASAARPSAR